MFIISKELYYNYNITMEHCLLMFTVFLLHRKPITFNCYWIIIGQAFLRVCQVIIMSATCRFLSNGVLCANIWIVQNLYL